MTSGTPQPIPSLKGTLVPFAEATPWPVIIVDEAGRVLYLNSVMESARGMSLSQLGDRDFVKLFPEYAKVLVGEVPWMTPQDAAVVRSHKNLTVHERVWVRKLPRGACLTIVDETRVRELESSQAQTARLASLGFMLASVSHEIGNPLAAIHSMLQILQSRRGVTPQTTERGLATMAASVRRLIAISRKLNSFSRVSAEPPAEFSLDVAIEEATAVFGYDSLGETVEVIHHADSEALVYGQSGEVQQVFYNLFLNAAQAMKGQGMITVQVRRQGAVVHATVHDTGPGIPTQDLDRVFEPFYTTKRKVGSTGLGLSISQEIIQEHGGSIRAEAHPEGGALFHICLPAAQHQEGP